MSSENEIQCVNSPHNNNTTIFPPDMIIWLYNKRMTMVHVPAIVFSGLLMVFGVAGNGLVVYAYGFRFKKTSANVYILWLAVCDMFCCCVVIPFEIYHSVFLVYSRTSVRVTCKIFRFLSYTSYAIQGLTLICIAVDRYFKICKSMKMASRNPVYSLVAIIAIVPLFTWPAGLIYGNQTVYACVPGVYGEACSMDDAFKDTIYPLVYYAVMLSAFFVCLFILLALYIRIGTFIWKWKNSRLQKLCRTSELQWTFENDMPKIESNQQCKQKFSSSYYGNSGIYTVTKTVKFLYKKQNGMSGTYNPTRQMVLPETVDELPMPRMSDIDIDTRNAILSETTFSVKSRVHSKLKDQARTSKSVFMFTFITVCFILSYVPYFICEVLKKSHSLNMNDQSATVQKIIEIAEKSYCLNNACNPVIYSIFNPDFRRVCLDLFRIKTKPIKRTV